MFHWLGRWVYRARYAVIVGFVVVMGVSGAYGLGYQDRLTAKGYFDETSESVLGTELADDVFGRDFDGDVIALYTAPPGKHITDAEFDTAGSALTQRLLTEYRTQIKDVSGYWNGSLGKARFLTKDADQAFISIGLQGDGDQDSVEFYRQIHDKLGIPGLDVQVAGRVPVSDEVGLTMQHDVERMHLIALPLVAIVLFFVFGGVIAASLPMIIGGLTIAGAWGVMNLFTGFMPVNTIADAVLSLIGLGLAIDYGLFMVSRFREEIAEGASVEDAVRTTVSTAGRTIAFSATIIVVCVAGALIFPMVFLRSAATAALVAVVLAAVLSITVLPAMLGVLGKRVDAFGFRAFNRTRTTAQIDASFWSRLSLWSMQRPALLAVPIIAVLGGLLIPFFQVEWGTDMTEKYLPPNNETRTAQQDFDAAFPTERVFPLKLVIDGADRATANVIADTASKAVADGLTGEFKKPFSNGVAREGANVRVFTAGLKEGADTDAIIGTLRTIQPPEGVRLYVTGMPALGRDTLDGLVDRMPMLLAILVLASFVMMFLAFGSFVLPIKAIFVSFLSLTATLGFLTYVFYDGHGARLLDFTPQPLFVPILVIMIAIIFGLSTDYEIFLMSRMAEAREKGAATPEAIRYGTAHTGGIITAAALVLIVVTGSFGLSEIVLMKYIAYGMIVALILDATIIRMLLVPAVMKLLGDACWWAPGWAKRLHRRIGLAEYETRDEAPKNTVAEEIPA
ncbi:MMPL family transporter [Nocardia huaxiensis]|uniref:MMPL family transporter n=1 Tax=Nocardia huaxiensis TaxID=2755382 RepID=A0A7D6ZGY0_9NOCA|nr:MMPL family transporter [Nocardia huaxiensis]QLY29520.1 MMPL family transporter [Nocardia huaxiensis]UFS96922.1 MMPL family transporter [Nocardia huaxiensis]